MNFFYDEFDMRQVYFLQFSNDNLLEYQMNFFYEYFMIRLVEYLKDEDKKYN